MPSRREESSITAEIRRQGYRLTPQRQLVLDVIGEHGEHLSANDIIAAVREQAPALNRATVYRVLQFLCDLQLITRTEIRGQAVYERAWVAPHHHLVCRACGQVQELPDHYFEPLAAQLHADYDFQAELNHLALSGLCARCHARGVEL